MFNKPLRAYRLSGVNIVADDDEQKILLTFR